MPAIDISHWRGVVHLFLDGETAWIKFLCHGLAFPALLNRGVIQRALVGNNTPQNDARMVTVSFYHFFHRVAELLPARSVIPSQGFFFHHDAEPVACVQEGWVCLIMRGTHKVDAKVML